MISTHAMTVRPVAADDRRNLANLLHFEPLVHRHLDWRPPLEWIGSKPFMVLEDNGMVLAALACPVDPPSVAWIRLFAASSLVDDESAWKLLWHACKQVLGSEAGVTAAAIPLQGWFRDLLEESGFSHCENVVMLSWDRTIAPPKLSEQVGTLRPMNKDDLVAVGRVDHAAFDRLWRNTVNSLTDAFSQAASATVLEYGGELIGYQISTANAMGAHLARLAVLPERQGFGFGYFLVQDVLSQFVRRGITHVTVNTQATNVNSINLYKRVGFQQTGEVYPIFTLEIPKIDN